MDELNSGRVSKLMMPSLIALLLLTSIASNPQVSPPSAMPATDQLAAAAAGEGQVKDGRQFDAAPELHLCANHRTIASGCAEEAFSKSRSWRVLR
jgi:hypothetical protein